MTSVTFPPATPFASCATSRVTKEAALKVLEEAAELVEAVKEIERDRVGLASMTISELLSYELERDAALDEAMDVYQALANLLAGTYRDDEIAEAYERCVERNRERGRL